MTASNSLGACRGSLLEFVLIAEHLTDSVHHLYAIFVFLYFVVVLVEYRVLVEQLRYWVVECIR